MKTGFIHRLSAWPAHRWVCVMLLAYFAIALSGTWINFLEFHLNAIGTYDLGLNQQSLSSTIHGGKPYPFYEATNCGRNDRCSYLLVHPVFLAYPVAAVYSLGPSPFTLFALQDAALALAVLPLFAIARQVMRSGRWALVASGVYLTWMPAFSGIFSFHWEAFIPVEIFTVFWLWLTGRYALALPVVILAYLTLEITPVLLFFIAIFFLIPYIPPVWAFLRARGSNPAEPRASKTARVRATFQRLAATVRRDRRVRASLALLIGSVLAYVLLHEFVRQGGFLLGLPPLPAKYSLPLTQPVYAANFTVSNLATGWPAKLVFWLVIFGTLAMIPLLAPRTLVISAPWIAYTLLSTSGFYRMGNQYAFIGASVLMIGFVYGLARLKLWMERSGTRSSGDSGPPFPGDKPGVPDANSTTWTEDPEGSSTHPAEVQAANSDRWAETGTVPEESSSQYRGGIEPTPIAADETRRWGPRLRSHRRAIIVGTVLSGILMFNLFLNPLNPWAAPLKTDQPFAEQADLGLGPSVNTTGYQQVLKLLSIMGPNAIVAVPSTLFPLVANDRYAYPLLNDMDPANLPFNVTSDTQYVVLDQHSGHLPEYLGTAIYNTSDFGVRGWVPSTFLGPIVLFQRGYAGPIEIIGTPPPVFPDVTYAPNSGLLPGPVGSLASSYGSISGYIIKTTLQNHPHHTRKMNVGQVFHSAPINLAPGSYRVTVTLMGGFSGARVGMNANSSIVVIHARATADIVERIGLNASWFAPLGWLTLTFNFTLPSPVFSFEISGSNLANWFAFQVDSVSITAVPDP